MSPRVRLPNLNFWRGAVVHHQLQNLLAWENPIKLTGRFTWKEPGVLLIWKWKELRTLTFSLGRILGFLPVKLHTLRHHYARCRITLLVSTTWRGSVASYRKYYTYTRTSRTIYKMEYLSFVNRQYIQSCMTTETEQSALVQTWDAWKWWPRVKHWSCADLQHNLAGHKSFLFSLLHTSGSISHGYWRAASPGVYPTGEP